MRSIILFILTVFFQFALFLLALWCFANVQNVTITIPTATYFLAGFPFIGVYLLGLLFLEKKSFSKDNLNFFGSSQRLAVVLIASLNLSSFLFLLIILISPYAGFYVPILNVFLFLGVFIPLLAVFRMKSEKQRGLDTRFFKRALILGIIVVAIFLLVTLAYGLFSGNLAASFKEIVREFSNF